MDGHRKLHGISSPHVNKIKINDEGLLLERYQPDDPTTRNTDLQLIKEIMREEQDKHGYLRNPKYRCQVKDRVKQYVRGIRDLEDGGYMHKCDHTILQQQEDESQMLAMIWFSSFHDKLKGDDLVELPKEALFRAFVEKLHTNKELQSEF